MSLTIVTGRRRSHTACDTANFDKIVSIEHARWRHLRSCRLTDKASAEVRLVRLEPALWSHLAQKNAKKQFYRSEIKIPARPSKSARGYPSSQQFNIVDLELAYKWACSIKNEASEPILALRFGITRVLDDLVGFCVCWRLDCNITAYPTLTLYQRITLWRIHGLILCCR